MMAGGKVEFKALGTTAVVIVTDPGRLEIARAVVAAEIDAIDLACSRFRPDSDLERVNRAGGRPTKVSSLCIDAVLVGLRAAKLTNGDVDPTIGRAIRLLGYDRDFASVPASGAAVKRAQHVPGWHMVEVDAVNGVLSVPPKVLLDLGATAKAFCADRAAAAAADAAQCGVLVSLGGDIAIAGEAPARGWEIRVTDSHAAGPYAEGQTIALSSGGLATSSTTVRRWNRGGDDMHHVVDPSTGRPASVVWRTVSVVAGNCVDANVASTASIIRGERAPGWLESMDLPARLVLADGGVVRVGGWPADEVAA